MPDVFISYSRRDKEFVARLQETLSEVCQKELNHAVKHHKRLIPMVRRIVDPKDVQDLLARLHWIFCREGDDFMCGPTP